MNKSKMFKYLATFLLIVITITFFNKIKNSIDSKLELNKTSYLFLTNPNTLNENNYIKCEAAIEHTLYLYDEKTDYFTATSLNKTINKTKKLALIIYPSIDHNNAFIHQLCKKTFKKTQKDFHLFLVRPTSINHLKNAISDFNKLYGLIDCLWIQGHGQKDNLKLNYKENFKYDSLQENTLAYLHPKAKIFLDSCHTGKKGGLAQKLSTKTKGRKIYAASQRAYAKLVDFTNGEIKFKNLRKENITTCYKNGINIA